MFDMLSQYDAWKLAAPEGNDPPTCAQIVIHRGPYSGEAIAKWDPRDHLASLVAYVYDDAGDAVIVQLTDVEMVELERAKVTDEESDYSDWGRE